MEEDHTEKKSQVVIIGGGLGGLLPQTTIWYGHSEIQRPLLSYCVKDFRLNPMGFNNFLKI